MNVLLEISITDVIEGLRMIRIVIVSNLDAKYSEKTINCDTSLLITVEDLLRVRSLATYRDLQQSQSRARQLVPPDPSLLPNMGTSRSFFLFI